MALKLSTLFKSKNTLPNVAAPEQNSDAKRDTETYSQWGKRICATSFASDAVLRPFLLNVYNYIKREQAQDAAYQEQARAEIESRIKQNENNIELGQNKVTSLENQMDSNKEHLEQLRNDKHVAQQKTYKVNREARAKMLVGLIILIPLTVYLFMFYSSTFYSAFLAGNDSGITDASAAMFRPNAFGEALDQSVFSLFLIIVFPIVFMGLGFILHYFSQDNDGIKKYLKIGTIIFVTFTFDCILAFKIGDTIHNSLVNNDLIPESVYSISTAVKDVSFWAVIFCGFISYIIWGLVFNLVQDGYEKQDQNKLDIQTLDDKISELQSTNKSLASNINVEKQKITDLKNENAKSQVSLIGTTFFNEGAIRMEMTNFFSGWIAQMAFLGRDKNQQDASSEIFNQTINTLGL